MLSYFFDVFISYRKCQDTLQLNTCVKYCMSTLLRQEIKANNDLNAMYVDTVEICKIRLYIYVYLFIISTIQHLQNILDLMGLMLIQLICKS